MIINFYIKKEYGLIRQYIADTEIAEIISELTKMKTVLPNHVEALERLGFEFIEIPVPRRVI